LALNYVKQDIKKALELAAVCDHAHAVWLTKLFAGRNVAKKFFLAVKTMLELFALLVCLAILVRLVELLILAMRLRKLVKSVFDGRKNLLPTWTLLPKWNLVRGRRGRAKENYLVGAELGHVSAIVTFGELLGKDEPQRFVWLGRAASNGDASFFLDEMSDHIENFNSATGHAKVVFAIARALKGQVDSEERTIFGIGEDDNFDSYIGPANQALHFFEFQLQSYRRAVDSWTIVGLRNGVVKDIRKMIGKMIWDAREEAAY
jgi:hypothetical protein